MQYLSKTPFMYKGHLLSNNLKAFATRHCLNISSTGGLFIFLSSVIPTMGSIEKCLACLNFLADLRFFMVFTDGRGTVTKL